MVKKKTRTTKRKTNSTKKASNTKGNPANTTDDAKAIAEKIFANLKKPD